MKTGKVYKHKIKKKMNDFLRKTNERHLQFHIVFHVQLVRETSDGEEVRIKGYLHSSTRRLIHMDYFNEIYTEAIESVNKKLDKFHEMGSGWRLEKILEIKLNLARYQPIRGGSSFADTPAGLRGKQAIVNVQNDDQSCFLYSVLAHQQ